MEQKKYTVTKEDILLDLTLLTDGIFDGEVARIKDGLEVWLSNGQVFALIVAQR